MIRGWVNTLDLWDGIDSKQIWRRFRKYSAAMSTMTSIRPKNLRTTQLPPCKQSGQRRRAFVTGITKNPMVTLRAPEFLCGVRRTFQKGNYLCSNPPIGPKWPEGRRSLVKGTRQLAWSWPIRKPEDLSDAEKQNSLVWWAKHWSLCSSIMQKRCIFRGRNWDLPR